ncbi:MAG TPA: hypothetical protein VF488_12880 [Gemmatimonadaceae bacterium]
MQLGAYRFPGDDVVGVRQRLTRAPLDLAGPHCGYIGLGLAVQAGEQILRQLGALGHRQVQRIVQQLAGSLGHRAHDSKPERKRNRGVHDRDAERTTSELRQVGADPLSAIRNSFVLAAGQRARWWSPDEGAKMRRW